MSVLTLFGFWGFSKLNDVLRDRIDEDMIVKDVAEAIKRVQRASVAFMVAFFSRPIYTIRIFHF